MIQSWRNWLVWVFLLWAPVLLRGQGAIKDGTPVEIPTKPYLGMKIYGSTPGQILAVDVNGAVVGQSSAFPVTNATFSNFGIGLGIGTPTTGTTTGGAQFGDRNTIIGIGACAAITTARESICIGPGALQSFTGLPNDNVNVDMIENGLNIAIGSYAFNLLVQTPFIPPGGGGPYQSQDNVGVGQKAGINLTGSSSSNFFGNHTCTSCTLALNTNIFGAHAVNDIASGVQYMSDVNVMGSQSWNGSGNKSNINSVGAFIAQGATTANNVDVMGDSSLPNCTTCSYDEVVGSASGLGIVAGTQNVIVGGKAGPRTTDMSAQLMLGYEVCYNCTTVTNSTLAGWEAAAFYTGTLNSVTALGSAVMQSATGNISANVFIGDQTALHVTGAGGGSNGNQNVWVGSKAFNNATTLNQSTCVGNQCGGGATLTGTNLNCFGSSACNGLTSSESNDIAIGKNATPASGVSGAQQYGSGTNSVPNSVQFNSWGSITGLAGAGPLWQTAIATGTPTFAPGSNITSVVCASGYSCDNRRGELTIVAGAGASTGVIATVSFSAALATAPGLCMVHQNGGTGGYVIGHGTPSTSSFTISAGVSVASATLTVDYSCAP